VNQFVKLAAFLAIAALVVSPALAQHDADAEKPAAEKGAGHDGEGAPAGPTGASGSTPTGVGAATTIPSNLLLACGAALTVIGAAWGIGRIGACAVESMARQPEVAGNIQTAMLISAALIEGATFFALIICFMLI
jgi:F-type H+-transporting ATPase subunit c